MQVKDYAGSASGKFLEAANSVLLVGLIAWTFFVLRRAFSFPGLPFKGDYGLNLQQSLHVLHFHSFPHDFVYPLPYILLTYFLFKAAGFYSVILWMCAIASAFYFNVRFLLAEFYTGDKRFTYLFFLLSFLPVAYYIQLDMTTLNCNLIDLSLVLLSMQRMKKGDWLSSGFFLALGVALKLYPIVLLPYLLLRKKFRVVLSTLAWTTVFFVLFPVLALGGSCFIELTGKWFQVLASTGAPGYLVSLPAHKISLHYAILLLLSHGHPAQLLPPALYRAKATIFWLRMLIAGLGLLYLVFDLRKPLRNGEFHHILFISVLILSASLLFSELLQPHHLVILLGCSIILMDSALNGDLPRRDRWILAALIFLPFLALKIAPSEAAKALAMNAQIVLYILCLMFLRLSS
ncbi:MAG: glycosyltransferase family 87 protein [Syntrophobacteraceae bacterium]